MFKIFDFKKPSKAEVLAARQVISNADKIQAAEKTRSSIAPVEKKPVNRFAEAVRKINEAIGKLEPATKKDDGNPADKIEPIPKPLPIPVPQEPEPPTSPVTSNFVPGIRIEDTSIEAEKKPALPFVSGCPTDRVKYEIDGANRRRLDRGWPLFTSYEQYCDFDREGAKVFEKNYGPEVIDGTANGKTSAAEVFFIVSQGYYLAYDNGRCFFLDSSDQYSNGVPCILKSNGETSPRAILTAVKLDTSKNLNRKQFDDLVNARPSVDSLLNAYQRYSNDDGILLNTDDVTTVW